MMHEKTPVTSNTRIKTLLDADQQGVVEALVKLNRNFSKLKNPILRNLFARRVTISDACRIANCEVQAFLNTLQQIGFIIGTAEQETAIIEEEASPKVEIDLNRQVNTLELDARPYLDKNGDPLKEILHLVKMLKKGERLKIINSFEPVPLISLLNDKGFLHHTELVAEQLVYTWFEKANDEVSDSLAPMLPETNEQKVFDTMLNRFKAEKIRYIDVRELEMPQPMLLIMSNIESLAADEVLYVYHKKVPVFLFPELDKRALGYSLMRKSDTELDLLIYRNEC